MERPRGYKFKPSYEICINREVLKMVIKKIPNPEYKEVQKLVASQETIAAKAAVQHARRQTILFKLCKEKERAVIALNKITDKVEDAFSARNDSESLLSETRATLVDVKSLLSEIPKYIRGDN